MRSSYKILPLHHLPRRSKRRASWRTYLFHPLLLPSQRTRRPDPRLWTGWLYDTLIFKPEMSLFVLMNVLIPSRNSSLISPSSSIDRPPVASLLPPQKTQPSTISTVTEESLALEYQPLPKREKTSEELRVEALARQLVGQQ